MTGKNIPEEIRKGLDARLEGMSTFGETTLRSPALGPVSEETEEFRLSREAVENCSPYVRMIGGGVGDSFYVMSGMFNTDSNPEAFEAIQSDINYINSRPSTSNLTGAESYYELGKSEDIREKRFGYKEPGINTLSVTNLSDGLKGGAVKQAVVQFTVWRMNQLDEFQRLSFLSLGATVIIDWGWVRGDKSIQSILEPPSIVVKDGDKVSLDFDLFKEETVDGKTQASEWVKHSKKKYGDWDGLIGVVTKVDWNVNEEGAFECSATVQGKGSHAFEDPITIKERHNGVTPLYASETGVQDIETFRYAWYKKVEKKIETLTLKEQEALQAVSIEDAENNARTGPEASLPERISGLDVEILTKLFQGLQDAKNKVKSSDPVAAMSSQQEVALIYYPYEKLDEKGKGTGKYDTNVLSQDEKTEEYYQNTQFRYDMWINWGWFEDNVVSYYARRFGDNAPPSAVFRSIDSEGMPIRIKNDPNLKTLTNSYLLPGQTPIDWIPDQIGDAKNSQKNPYKTLAELINQAPEFAMPGDPNSGILRHVYVNINLIKSVFTNPGISISGGMLMLAEALNSPIPLWNFEIQINDEGSTADNGKIPTTYSIVDNRARKSYSGSDVLDPGKSYIFENNGLNSLVKSCNVSTDISSRLGAAMYFGRQKARTGILEKIVKQNEMPFPDEQEAMNLASFYAINNQTLSSIDMGDPLSQVLNQGASGEAANPGRKFNYGTADPLGELKDEGLEGNQWNHDIAIEQLRLYPTSLGARLDQYNRTMKQVMEFGSGDIDAKKVIEDTDDSLKDKIKELQMYAFPTIQEQDIIKKDDPDEARKRKLALYPYQDGLNMHFNWLRTLDLLLNENPVTSLLQEAAMDEVTFLPIKCTIEIDGIGGLNLLDMFRLSYLPPMYKQGGDQPGTYFVIINLNHTIDQDGWKTEITGQIQIDNDRYFDVGDQRDKEEKIKDALQEAFGETLEEATAPILSDDEDEPTPQLSSELPPPRPLPLTILEPDDQIKDTIIFDPNDTEGIHRIGDPNTRVVDQLEGPQGPGTSRWNYFDYDGLSNFMSPDKTDGGFNVYERVNDKLSGRATRFPGRSFANPEGD